MVWEANFPRNAHWPRTSGCGGRVQNVGRAPMPLEANMAANVPDAWHGPGAWNYMSPFPNEERLTGAMWVRLDEAVGSMHAAEGFRGLLSGGVLAKRERHEEEDERWRQTGSRALGIRGTKDSERGGNIDEKQGRWVWPDVLEVGGVEYHRTGEDKMVFKSKEGKVFDLAKLDH